MGCNMGWRMKLKKEIFQWMMNCSGRCNKMKNKGLHNIKSRWRQKGFYLNMMGGNRTNIMGNSSFMRRKSQIQGVRRYSSLRESQKALKEFFHQNSLMTHHSKIWRMIP
jgi:hypothetical protein